MNIKVDREIMTVMLDKVRNGHIAVPLFQRDYIWSSKQIVEFFDSILRRYPIGSLILWMPETDKFKTLESIEGINVNKLDNADVWYVLDGRQRITTLLSTLYEGGANSRKYFINLEEDCQVIGWNRSKQPTKLHWLCLSEALDSFALVGYLERLSRSDLPETTKAKYATKAKEINKTLMAYEISYTIVRGGNIEDAVEIFSRLNSKTTLISTDYMIQALAYDTDNDFLFADAISEIKNGLAEYGLGDISREVVLKCVYNYTDKPFVDCKAEDLLAIKNNLKSITDNLKDDTRQAAKFLNEECGVVDTKLLPYIYQFVMISLFFRYNKDLTTEQTLVLKRWFFYTSYSAYFTNTSLGEIRRNILTFSEYCKGKLQSPIEYEKKITVAELPGNWSLGAVRTCAFVLTQISRFRSENIECFDIYTIPGTGKRNSANAIYCFSRSDKAKLASLFKENGWDDSVECSYGVTEKMFDLYRQNKIDEFLDERNQYLREIESKFVDNLFHGTGIEFDGMYDDVEECRLDKRIEILLQWLLKETDWYITHPLDVDRLHEVANLLADLDIPYNIETLKEYCRSLNWPEDTVEQIAKAINVAKYNHFNTLGRINVKYLKEIVNKE